MANIAIFASGSGSNAEKLIQYFQDTDTVINIIITNKASAGVIARAESFKIPVQVFSKDQFNQPSEIISLLKAQQIDLIILAGFLLKISPDFIQAFPERIINLHPSLLPKYGGKGMYGAYVHEAVLAAKEKESGITIHIVNEHFDEGRVLEQHKVAVSSDDTVASLSKKIQLLEHTYFPKAIKSYLMLLNN